MNITSELQSKIDAIRENGPRTVAELSFLSIFNFAFSLDDRSAQQVILNELSDRLADLDEPSARIEIEKGN